MSMLQAMVEGISTEELINNLARELSLIHGEVHIRHESSGTHLAMACPKCLAEYGRRELRSRHLQINVDKYFGLGEHTERWKPAFRDAEKKKGYAQCMKEHGAFSMAQIRSYPPLEARGIMNHAPIRVVDGGKRYLVPDEKGNMIPDHPGQVIPITNLPYAHPALLYLRYRDYDPALLYKQFRASWCVKEAPEGEQYFRWYRSHEGGWKSTPQGRIIFYSDVLGTQVCWQGRYLEIPYEERKLVWHPYRERWEEIPWQDKKGPIKYNTATGALRNNQLCGYDNAIQYLATRPDEIPTAVLTEGPLDAGRFPTRGIAILGKSMSQEQILLFGLKFRRAILAFDADKPGALACETVKKQLASQNIKTVNFFTPEEQAQDGKQDVGELGYAACGQRLPELLKQLDQAQ